MFLSLPLLPYDLPVFVKENPDRKKNKYLLTANNKDVKLQPWKSRNELTIDFKHVFGHCKQKAFISFNQFYQYQCLTFQASG